MCTGRSDTLRGLPPGPLQPPGTQAGGNRCPSRAPSQPAGQGRRPPAAGGHRVAECRFVSTNPLELSPGTRHASVITEGAAAPMHHQGGQQAWRPHAQSEGSWQWLGPWGRGPVQPLARQASRHGHSTPAVWGCREAGGHGEAPCKARPSPGRGAGRSGRRCWGREQRLESGGWTMAGFQDITSTLGEMADEVWKHLHGHQEGAETGGGKHQRRLRDGPWTQRASVCRTEVAEAEREEE